MSVSFKKFQIIAVGGLLLFLISPIRTAEASSQNQKRTGQDSGLGNSNKALFDAFEVLPGGDTTNKSAFDARAFSLPASNLDFDQRLTFNLGNALFKRPWVSAPSSTVSSDGLGPLFNARACQSCHLRDGRGTLPVKEGERPTALILRISREVPADEKSQSKDKMILPDPNYGFQLQDLAIKGISPEATVSTYYDKETFLYPDGHKVELYKPRFELSSFASGPLHPDTKVSPRMAPPVFGLGLVEAIKEKDILANEDPNDLDKDGISGRANYALDLETNRKKLGRFGWKASQPSLNQQNQAAFNGDIGMSTPLFMSPHGDCQPSQTLCLSMPDGEELVASNVEPGVKEASNQTNLPEKLRGMKSTDDAKAVKKAKEPEVPGKLAELVLFYTQHLAPPMRRNAQSETVLQGKKLFLTTGCEGCHTQSFVTGNSHPSSALRNQKIYPFSDFLLHDMGERLADNRSDGLATGREWRTAPLWGISHTKTVSTEVNLLHDGRARTVEQAILWHGGEAQSSVDTFVKLKKEERQKLIEFINSL